MRADLLRRGPACGGAVTASGGVAIRCQALEPAGGCIAGGVLGVTGIEAPSGVHPRWSCIALTAVLLLLLRVHLLLFCVLQMGIWLYSQRPDTVTVVTAVVMTALVGTTLAMLSTLVRCRVCVPLHGRREPDIAWRALCVCDRVIPTTRLCC